MNDSEKEIARLRGYIKEYRKSLKEKDAEIERLRGICHELVGDESYADIAYPPGF